MQLIVYWEPDFYMSYHYLFSALADAETIYRGENSADGRSCNIRTYTYAISNASIIRIQ